MLGGIDKGRRSQVEGIDLSIIGDKAELTLVHLAAGGNALIVILARKAERLV
jgi:hypothetical protein